MQITLVNTIFVTEDLMSDLNSISRAEFEHAIVSSIAHIFKKIKPEETEFFNFEHLLCLHCEYLIISNNGIVPKCAVVKEFIGKGVNF